MFEPRSQWASPAREDRDRVLLGIDTATRRVGVVVGDRQGVMASTTLDGSRVGESRTPRHVEQLVPAIKFCCDQLGRSVRNVSAVAVSVGPGMFTGLRVGVTTAKVFAQVLRVPMIPVPSLDLAAYPLYHANGIVVAALDARRGEVYYAIYQCVPGGIQRISDYALASPKDVVCELEARKSEVLLCGDGIFAYRETFAELDRATLAEVGHGSPDLAALLHLAVSRHEREEFVAPADVMPLYLRKSDAEIERDRKA